MGRKQNSHWNPTRCSINFSSFVMFSQLFTQTKELKVNMPRNQLLRPEYFYTAAHLVLFILFCQFISWYIPEYFRSCLLSCYSCFSQCFLRCWTSLLSACSIYLCLFFHVNTKEYLTASTLKYLPFSVVWPTELENTCTVEQMEW